MLLQSYYLMFITIIFVVEINMDATENSLIDARLNKLVWLYVGCFPLSG